MKLKLNRYKGYTLARMLAFIVVLSSLIIVFKIGASSGLNEAHPDRIADGFYGVEPDRGHGHVEMGIYGVKLANCNFIAESAKGFVYAGGKWIGRDVNFIFVTPSEKKRGVGKDYFNRWRWEYLSMGMVEKVAVIVNHDCNGELRPTVIGYFDIRSYKDGD